MQARADRDSGGAARAAQRAAELQAFVLGGSGRASPQTAVVGPQSLGRRASPAGHQAAPSAGAGGAAAGPKPFTPVGRVAATHDEAEDVGPRTAPAGSRDVARPSRAVLQQEFQRLEALMQKL